MAKATVQTEQTLVIRKPLRRFKVPGVECGEGLTEQCHKRECDMNYILRDYQAKGIVKHVSQYTGQYDDITVTDFQEAMFMVKDAQNMFNDLPSSLRKRFGNDPAEFLKFVSDGNNREEMAKLGMLKGNDGLTGKGAPSDAPTEEK